MYEIGRSIDQIALYSYIPFYFCFDHLDLVRNKETTLVILTEII